MPPLASRLKAAPRHETFVDGPRLLADIGVTNAHFALEMAPDWFASIGVLPCADYSGLVEVTRAYLERVGKPQLRHAAVAIANPIEGDLVRMTNRHWQFSIEETRRVLGLETLLVVNDFTALAQALPYLDDGHRRQVGGGAPQANGVIGLIGPGSGLGVSGLISAEDRWITLGSEGGHASFSPTDERELYVLQYAWREFPHVSSERLVTNSGIELIYRALASRAGAPLDALTAQEIVRRALSGNAELCADALDCFCGMLGTVAANVAVTLGAVGGIYIGGGIVPRLGEAFDRSSFRRRFETKGRFSSYLAQIPTYVITAENPAFLGVSAILSEHLKGSPFLDRVRHARGELSQAEQRVAHFVLGNPRAVLTDPIADIARNAGVSQPTVIRFCRSMGCQGLADFKIKLASGLTGTIPVRHSQVKLGDAVPDLSAKVMDNTVSAILKLRDSLDTDALGQAIALLRQARRIELYGLGNSSVVALDGQHKFVRCRIPAIAYSEPNAQTLSAELLGKDDVVIAVSSSGRSPDLLTAVDLALEAGASVIAITAGKSQLAKKATVTLAVDHDEESSTHIAMISRILHLLVIDVLAVGIAIARADSLREIGKQPRTPGRSTREEFESPLSTLISHTSG